MFVDHQHHLPSLEALSAMVGKGYTTAVHCLSECYSNLTRTRTMGGLALTPQEAMVALERFEAALEVLSLSAGEHQTALRSFADAGGRGPRLYDYLIGYAAVVHFVPVIVTWNTRHFLPLFPQLRVLTPAELLETL